MSADLRLPSFVLLLGLAWLLAALQLVVDGWAATAFTLPDADDAMRLVELREFLAGKGWFDLHETRLAPPLGYDSHWSRLIDAGLAAFVLGFGTILAPDAAERLTVAVWPVLWLLPTIGAVGALAWRMGGPNAALVALLLAAFSLPAFQQFRLGRIDHHNIHITLSLLTVAASASADQWRQGSLAAGLLTGLALAIGFESLPFVMVAGLGFTLRFALSREAAGDLRVYGLTVAAGAVVAFLISVPPARWMQSVCDAIAINSMMAVMVGALALAIAGQFCRSEDWRRRVLALTMAGVVAMVVFVLFEPRCLGGPFAMVDRGIGPAWIDHVAEVQSASGILHHSVVTGLATMAFPAAALLALLALLVLAPGRRDTGFLIAAVAFVLALAMTLAVVKAFSYAVWFGLPLVATVLARIPRIVPRALAALILTPTAVSIGAIWLGSSAGARPLVLNTPERQACVSKDGASALASLPVGLIVTNELEWGPYLLAFTPHSIFAAPYHRLSSKIVTAHAAFARPADIARRIIIDNHVDYVVICGPNGPLGVKGEALKTSLWSDLRANQVPDWLETVPLEGSFIVYRVRR